MKRYSKYWNDFINSSNKNSIYRESQYNWFAFGGNTDELAELVLSGEKTGTSSLYDCYTHDKEEIPKKGLFSIVLNSKNEPICIIRINDVQIIKFESVSEEHAKMEIKGKKSLEKWKLFHSKFFNSEAKNIGKIFTEKSLIVFEIFTVIYTKNKES